MAESTSSETVVERFDGGMSWRRRGVAGVLDVCVSVARCMGDSTFQIEITHRETGATVSFLDESPELIAVHVSGAWVWHQGEYWGERRDTVHDLGTGRPPPYPDRPPREEVILISEAIGSDCPRISAASRGFEFAPPDRGA